MIAAAAGVLFGMFRGGISWSQTCLDLGLHRGQGVLREIGAGIVGYMLILPIFAVGFILMIAFSLVIAAAQQAIPGAATGTDAAFPSHPVIGMFTTAPLPTQLAILFGAAILIPVIEEVMFRG
ncbi:MAG: hypothetical protein ACOC0P_05900, partial [Planctomycetota bacterium]